MAYILPRFLRPRSSADPTTPNNESDLLFDLATGLARDRGDRRRSDPAIPPRYRLPVNIVGGVTLTSLDPLPRGSNAPNRNPPALPRQPSIVFGSPAPQPAPAPRPRRRPQRRPRRSPRRRAPTRRTLPKLPFPEPPQAPTPDRPATPKVPSRRLPIPIPIDIPTSIPEALFGMWKRLLDEYLQPHYPRSPGGGPRRGGGRTRQPTPPGRVTVPMPGPLPVDLPTRSTERSPRQSEIFQPPAALPSPFPDPSAQPAPSPAGYGRPAAAPARRRGSLLLAPPVSGSVPQVRVRGRRQPGRNPPRSTPSSPSVSTGRLGYVDELGQPRVGSRTPAELTAFQRGQLDLPPQQSSDPCAQRARDAKRRQRKRRKECTEWVTKEVRVCQSSNVK